MLSRPFQMMTAFLTSSTLKHLLFATVHAPSAASTGAAYENAVLGVRLMEAGGLRVVEDEVLDEHSYGFNLVKLGGADEGYLVLRVGLRYNAPPDVDQAVAAFLSQIPDVAVRPADLTIDGRAGTMLSSVPGRFGSTVIFVVANDHLYELIYAADTLDEEGEALLRALHFVPPSRRVTELGLPAARARLAQASPFAEAAQRVPDAVDFSPEEDTLRSFDPPTVVDVAAGCALWPHDEFIQTPISSTANGTGRSKAGPSWYGEGRHLTCGRLRGLNDFYALDFPLRTGDVVYAPFEGRVKWTGWASAGWSELGRIVIVEKLIGADCYWSLSAHLSSINVQPGAEVKFNTVIGFAGGSGDRKDDHWSPHLHQGIYLNANLVESAGGIFGGQSVQPRRIRFFDDGGGFYEAIKRGQEISW